MHITPAMLETAYEFLRTTAPFRSWKLPEADDVEFCVGGGLPKGCYADYTPYSDGTHRIRITCEKHRTPAEMLVSLAHEMVHLHQCYQETLSKGRTSVPHGRKFNALADKVCRAHGFDRKTF